MVTSVGSTSATGTGGGHAAATGTGATGTVTERGTEIDTQGSGTGAAAHALGDLAQKKEPDGRDPVNIAAASIAGGHALVAEKRLMAQLINLAPPQR